MKRLLPFLCLLSLLCATPRGGSAQTLKVVTLNVWSGLDYRGFFAFGEHESDEQRDQRFRILVDGLRTLDPDVIALQEVNPVYRKAEDLAAELGYDALYLRGNAGIKFGGLGIPTNLNEGILVLARKDLELQLLDGIDLSSGFGASGNTFSFHFSDRNVGLAVHIRKQGVDLILMNIHLLAAPPDTPEVRAKLSTLVDDTSQGSEAADLRRLAEGQEDRMREVSEVLGFLDQAAPNLPVVLVGDLNATPDSPELRRLAEEGGFQDIGSALPQNQSATWDPNHNTNTSPSTVLWRTTPAGADPFELLESWYDSMDRRIDYILLGPAFNSSDIRSVSRVFDRKLFNTYASDHFGLMAEIDLSRLPRAETQSLQGTTPPSLDILPIASYDTDVGFGVGLKTFYLNGLGASESIDVLLFASTGGERLAKLVFSIPDFELRQGRVYPLSFDLVVEYDKYLKNSFFGLGNSSQFADRETYTKEPIEIAALVGRGFSRSLVVEAGLKYKAVRNYNFSDTSLFAGTPPGLNQGSSEGLSLAFTARYDSRNSFINPSTGTVVQFDTEYGSKNFLSDYSIFKSSLSLQGYRAVISPRTILAVRLSGQIAQGDSLPVHTLPWLGGSKTLRGYPLDRYLDKVRLLSTLELRLPLVWRVGAVVGLDAGKVWNHPSEIDLRNWAWNGVVGLRFYFDTFVARADLGISREYTGFYLDFGHAF